MRALVLQEWGTAPSMLEIDTPVPGPGEVLLRVGGAGCCHSDVSMYNDFNDATVPFRPPYVLGHENAGWVESTGPGVTGVDLGAGYAVYGPLGCGHCTRCAAGAVNYCANLAALPAWGLGVGRNGGMAEFMLVPVENLVPLGDLSPAVAAPLTDAGLTPYHAIQRSKAQLGAGSHALVLGLGGLGQLAVQILTAITGATVIGVDTKPEARALAQTNGASYTTAPGPEAAAQIRELSHGRGIEAAFDFVGRRATVELALACAAVGSDVTVVGIADEPIEWSFFRVPPACRLSTVSWGSLPELYDVIELAAQGRITPEVELFSLDDAPLAYARLEKGELSARAVVVP